jgi:hypothetical protein
MKNIIYYAYLKNLNQSHLIQKRLFKMGYRWLDSGNTIMDYVDSYIFTKNKKIYHYVSVENNYISKRKEFKEEYINKQKEYIVKELKINGCFNLG